MRTHARWLNAAFDMNRRKMVVDSIVEQMSQIEDVDCIATIGISGLLIAPIVSHILGIPLVVCRNESLASHSQRSIEHDIKQPYRFVFIDDLVDTGSTLNNVCIKMRDTFPFIRLAGIIMYSDNVHECHSMTTLKTTISRCKYLCPTDDMKIFVQEDYDAG